MGQRSKRKRGKPKRKCFLGLNSTIVNMVNISSNCFIGANSLVSKNILKICDTSLRIDLFGTINSLNVSVATAIILYEIQSQRDE